MQRWDFLGRDSERVCDPAWLRGRVLTQPHPCMGVATHSSSSICWRFLTEVTLCLLLWGGEKKKGNCASKMILPLSLVSVPTRKKTSRWWPSAWLICQENLERQSWLEGVSAQQTHGCLWSNRGGTAGPEVRGLRADVTVCSSCHSPGGIFHP